MPRLYARKANTKITLSFFAFTVLLCFLSACTTHIGDKGTTPLVPELTFAHVQPLHINAESVEIENRYNTGEDEKDVSSSFPAPPDISLRRYAEARFKSVGQTGVLKFIIEEAHIYHTYHEPESMVSGLMHRGGKDQYDVFMHVRMFYENAEGRQSEHTILTFKKTLTVPENYSVSERELAQIEFMEALMKDVDMAVTDVLRHSLNLTLVDIEPMAGLLTTPESGEEQDQQSEQLEPAE